MSWLPIIPDEVPDVERQLGICLPRRYSELLGDPRVRSMLSHAAVGALVPGVGMQAFVEATEQLRRGVPAFPAAGVLATLPGKGRYLRFWLPDPARPDTLGDALYTWDTVEQRASRGGTSGSWIATMIDVATSAERPASMSMDAGLATRTLRTRPCAPGLEAALGTTGAAEVAAILAAPEPWHPCATVRVQGRYLLPCDLGEIPEGSSQPSVAVPPGTYTVEARVAPSTTGDGLVVGAVRLVLDGARVTGAREAGPVDVDLGAVAIYDRQAFLRQVPPRGREAWAADLLELARTPCVVIAGRDAEVLVVPSGDGDGQYGVLALTGEAGVIGLEVRFR